MSNSHLNLFRTYSKKERKHQLENELTRALAICLQEDSLFLNLFLDYIVKDTKHEKKFQHNFYNPPQIDINIQVHASSIGEFDHLFAISLSEAEMNEEEFWAHKLGRICDTICDIVIQFDDTAIIIEAKRDNVDCTSQLFNQVCNIIRLNEIEEEPQNLITPRDLAWPKLMEICLRTQNLQNGIRKSNRFLDDFIELVKGHNFRWLPEPSISSLSYEDQHRIESRINSAVLVWTNESDLEALPNRLGVSFDLPWANEILFEINSTGDLTASIYPGNTKGQGWHIFNDKTTIMDSIEIDKKRYQLKVLKHIKFTSFKRYFSGLWFNDDDLIDDLYNRYNFEEYSGRNKRGIHWKKIEELFDRCFNQTYNWRKQANWELKMLKSGKNQFDMSFGYSVELTIPNEVLREKDIDKDDLSQLVSFLNQIYLGFRNQLIVVS